MEYTEADTDSLLRERERCRKQLGSLKEKGFSLDLSREKPAPEQLALSLPMLDVLDHRSILDSENGQDCRSVGSLDGIPEARRLLGHMMGTHSARTLVSGNSSLSLIYQLISHGMTDGICGGKPWQEVRDRKFLCPVPGYDRHFSIAEHFGFELIPIPMKADGPDMDAVEQWVRDPGVKGIWCVPKYQNPTGAVFSSSVVRRFARLRPGAEDFRIFWDNAYCVHCFDGRCAEIPDILGECEKAGNADLAYAFCSTSLVTFPGAGISAVAASPANLIDIRSFLQFSVMGSDKLNQLRHARFFRGSAGLAAHMKKHAAILKPKFDAAAQTLSAELEGAGIADWTSPKGGYFLSFNTLPGCARSVIKMCGESGVTLSPPGSAYPYGHDPEDRNIVIAPSALPVEEVRQAVRVLCLSTKIVSIDRIVRERG